MKAALLVTDVSLPVVSAMVMGCGAAGEITTAIVNSPLLFQRTTAPFQGH